jgi:hypothetical protein
MSLLLSSGKSVSQFPAPKRFGLYSVYKWENKKREREIDSKREKEFIRDIKMNQLVISITLRSNQLRIFSIFS